MSNWITTNNDYGNWYNNSISTSPIRRYFRPTTLYYSRLNRTRVPRYNIPRVQPIKKKKIIIKIIKEIRELRLATEKSTCTISQDDIDEKSIIRKLNCSHCYHHDCIDQWFENNITCPLCMKKFIS